MTPNSHLNAPATRNDGAGSTRLNLPTPAETAALLRDVKLPS